MRKIKSYTEEEGFEYGEKRIKLTKIYDVNGDLTLVDKNVMN